MLFNQYDDADIEKTRSIMNVYSRPIESIIEIDPCGEGIPLDLVAEAEDIVKYFQKYVWQIKSINLNVAKDNLIEQLVRWLDIIGNPLYFQADGNQKNLVFNSESVNEFRKDMNDIRTKVRDNYCVLREATM